MEPRLAQVEVDHVLHELHLLAQQLGGFRGRLLPLPGSGGFLGGEVGGQGEGAVLVVVYGDYLPSTRGRGGDAAAAPGRSGRRPGSRCRPPSRSRWCRLRGGCRARGPRRGRTGSRPAWARPRSAGLPGRRGPARSARGTCVCPNNGRSCLAVMPTRSIRSRLASRMTQALPRATSMAWARVGAIAASRSSAARR